MLPVASIEYEVNLSRLGINGCRTQIIDSTFYSVKDSTIIIANKSDSCIRLATFSFHLCKSGQILLFRGSLQEKIQPKLFMLLSLLDLCAVPGAGFLQETGTWIEWETEKVYSSQQGIDQAMTIALKWTKYKYMVCGSCKNKATINFWSGREIYYIVITCFITTKECTMQDFPSCLSIVYWFGYWQLLLICGYFDL